MPTMMSMISANLLRPRENLADLVARMQIIMFYCVSSGSLKPSANWLSIWPSLDLLEKTRLQTFRYVSSETMAYLPALRLADSSGITVALVTS